MKKLAFISVLIMVIGICFTINAFAEEFYVIPVNRVFISWDKKLPVSTRFKSVLDGEAVLDKETGLVWAKDANISGESEIWIDAMDYCRNLNIGGRKGWRLPSVEEITSLVDKAEFNPTLPDGHPFINVQSKYYWSSTSYEGDSNQAWAVHMQIGDAFNIAKSVSYSFVWPVRGGN